MLATNIDPIRAEIVRLEALTVFDQESWDKALAELRMQERWAGLADAERRMRTAKASRILNVWVDLGRKDNDGINLRLLPVAVETEALDASQ